MMKKELFELIKVDPHGWHHTHFANMFVYPDIGLNAQIRALLTVDSAICERIINNEIEGIMVEVER